MSFESLLWLAVYTASIADNWKLNAASPVVADLVNLKNVNRSAGTVCKKFINAYRVYVTVCWFILAPKSNSNIPSGDGTDVLLSER